MRSGMKRAYFCTDSGLFVFVFIPSHERSTMRLYFTYLDLGKIYSDFTEHHMRTKSKYPEVIEPAKAFWIVFELNYWKIFQRILNVLHVPLPRSSGLQLFSIATLCWIPIEESFKGLLCPSSSAYWLCSVWTSLDVGWKSTERLVPFITGWKVAYTLDAWISQEYIKSARRSSSFSSLSCPVKPWRKHSENGYNSRSIIICNTSILCSWELHEEARHNPSKGTPFIKLESYMQKSHHQLPMGFLFFTYEFHLQNVY